MIFIQQKSRHTMPCTCFPIFTVIFSYVTNLPFSDYPRCTVFFCECALCNLDNVNYSANTEAACCKKPDNTCADLACHKSVNTKFTKKDCDKKCGCFFHNYSSIYHAKRRFIFCEPNILLNILKKNLLPFDPCRFLILY